MGNMLQQMSAIWARLEAAQRITLVLVCLGLALAITAISYGATRPDYRLLASGLSPGNVAKIAGELEAGNTAYRITDNETAILVPSKDLYRLRNVLAENGTLAAEDDGFKLLDRGRMWDSTFIEHKNYDRAVASELEASYRELPGVAGARVIIDRPAPSPFIGDEEAKPKASIKLEMRAGMRLTQRQITGVVHLASGAVAGLTTERVQVMDSSGILTPPNTDSGAAMAQTTLDAEIAREAHLSRKAQDLLDTVLGPGRSQVKVSVKLDFAKRTEASSDPTTQKALKENTTTTEEKTPVLGTGGVAGTASNVEGENAVASANAPLASKSMEDTHTEYVVGQRTVTQEDEVGRIKAMTVSILLDFKVVKVPKLDAKGQPSSGEMEEKREEYTVDEKKRFESLVLGAIGFNAAKGIWMREEQANVVDSRFSSVVQSMEMFREIDDRTVATASVSPFGFAALRDWAGFGLAGFAALAFLFIARGQLKQGASRLAEAADRARANVRDDKAAGGGDEEQRKRRADMKEAIRKKVQEDPAAAAQIIKKWMTEG